MNIDPSISRGSEQRMSAESRYAKSETSRNKYDDGLCSIQEYNQFKTRIFDAVDEWINYCDSDSEMGIAIEQATLDVEVCNKEDFLRQREEELKLASNSSRVQQETCDSNPQAREWFPLETLAKRGGPSAASCDASAPGISLEPDADAVLDLADQFCFVR